MEHSITIPKEVFGADVCEHGNSYASNCSDCDEIEYATLALSEVIDNEEDKMEMRIDNYIESMVDERMWK